MILLITILVFYLGLMYASIEGIREAYYFYSAVKSGESDNRNLHSLFWCQRLSVLLAPVLFTGITILSITYIVSSILCFSFIHNGCYYAMRNTLDVSIYPKRFKDESTTSTAKMELSYKQRFFLFVLGVLVFVAGIIISEYLKTK